MLARSVTKVAISQKSKESTKSIDVICVRLGKRRLGNNCSGGKKTKRSNLFWMGLEKLTKELEEMFATKAKMEERARRAVSASMAAKEAVKRAFASLETAVKSKKRISSLGLALNDDEAHRAAKEEERKAAHEKLQYAEEEKAQAGEKEEVWMDQNAEARLRMCHAVDHFNQVCHFFFFLHFVSMHEMHLAVVYVAL